MEQRNLELFSEILKTKEGREFRAYYVYVPYNNTYLKCYLNTNIYYKQVLNAYYDTKKGEDE